MDRKTLAESTTQSKPSNADRRKTFPDNVPPEPDSGRKKRSFLQKKVEPIITSLEVPFSQTAPIMGGSTKSINKDEVLFGTIDERDELAYEDLHKKARRKSKSFISKPDDSYSRVSQESNTLSPEYSKRTRAISMDNEEVDMQPKFRSEAKLLPDRHDLPMITINSRKLTQTMGKQETTDNNISINTVSNKNIEIGSRDKNNFMKPTLSSKVKVIDKPVSENNIVVKEPTGQKNKNFIRMNKNTLNNRSHTSLDKNENEVPTQPEAELLREPYGKVDFERSLRQETLQRPDSNKAIGDEVVAQRKINHQNAPRWQYTYKLDETNKQPEDEIVYGIRSENGNPEMIKSIFDPDPISGDANIQVMSKTEFEQRSIINKFDTLLASLKLEYDSLLVYCNDFAIRIADTIYCYDEFHRRFKRLMQMVDEIKTYKDEHRTSGTLNEFTRFEPVINSYELQTREVIELLEYVKSYGTAKNFYDKVISKNNKKFIQTFDRHITANFPLNLLSVYTIRFLIELHIDLDFTLPALVKKPLQYFQLFMHIKKFLNDLKLKITPILKTNIELKESLDIVVEVTDLYADFTEAFKKNEKKCDEIVKRYAKFPIKKNFYEKVNYAEFKKVKFNFYRDFT